MSDMDLDDLAAELGEFAPPEKKKGRPASEERVIAGFEDIQRFYEQHGRAPQHGEDRDIFERLYAVRLDRLRSLPDCRALLEPLDHQGLLTDSGVDASASEIDLDELADALADVSEDQDITVLRHVRTTAENQAAEEIAERKRCDDFVDFRPLFDQVRVDKALLAGQVRQMLQQRAQVTLGEVLTQYPLQQGLGELVAYVQLASESPQAVVDDSVLEAVHSVYPAKTEFEIRFYRIIALFLEFISTEFVD